MRFRVFSSTCPLDLLNRARDHIIQVLHHVFFINRCQAKGLLLSQSIRRQPMLWMHEKLFGIWSPSGSKNAFGVTIIFNQDLPIDGLSEKELLAESEFELRAGACASYFFLGFDFGGFGSARDEMSASISSEENESN